jgi:CRP/FNR family transcriptional regulator, cyclic AMP receptor protein
MPRKAPLNEHLTKIPLFAACDGDELRMISEKASTISYPAGTVLAEEGSVGAEFMAIVDGTVQVSVGGHVVNTLGPGDFFGEIALLDGGPRTATVTATTDVVAEVIEERDFRVLLYDVPSLSRKLLVGVAKRLRGANLALASDSPEG